MIFKFIGYKFTHYQLISNTITVKRLIRSLYDSFCSPHYTQIGVLYPNAHSSYYCFVSFLANKNKALFPLYNTLYNIQRRVN